MKEFENFMVKMLTTIGGIVGMIVLAILIGLLAFVVIAGIDNLLICQIWVHDTAMVQRFMACSLFIFWISEVLGFIAASDYLCKYIWQ